MPPAPPHPDEEARLAALSRYAELERASSPAIDRLVRAVRALTGAPIAIVSLVGRDRQWFQSCVGLDSTGTDRDRSFCAYTILSPEALVVEDTTADPRFVDNPDVTGPPYIRAYAGVPLITEDGHALGSLCAIDQQPRPFTDGQIDAMTELAPLVVRELEHRLAEERLGRSVLERIAGTGHDGSPLEALAMAVDATCDLAGVVLGGAHLVEDGRLVPVDVWRLPPVAGGDLLRQRIAGTTYDLAGHPLGDALATGGILELATDEVSPEVGALLSRLGVVSLVCVPVATPDGVEAMMTFGTSTPGGLEETARRRLAAMADAVARAIALSRHGAVSDLLADALEHRRRLESVADLRRELLTSVSHEVRTPLTVIRGAAHALARPELDGEQRDGLTGALIRNVDRLETLLGRFITASRAPSGVDPATLPAIPVADVVRGAVATTGAPHPPVTVDVEPVLASVEARPLAGVVASLVENALRHTPAGTAITVSARAQRDDLIVTVSDDGPGIPADRRDLVFEPLAQGTLLEAHAPGAGLGLTLVRAVALGYGGECWIDGGDAGGTTVHVRFPGVVRATVAA